MCNLLQLQWVDSDIRSTEGPPIYNFIMSSLLFELKNVTIKQFSSSIKTIDWLSLSQAEYKNKNRVYKGAPGC